jgi:uncharacterized protein (TIGR03435 family)
MGNGARAARNGRRTPFEAIVGALLFAIALSPGGAAPLSAQSVSARETATQPPSAQTAQPSISQPAEPQAPATPLPVPQWQIDAGGKMEFDVASVKPNTAPMTAQTVNSNIPLGPQDMFTPTGGLLSSTNIPLFQYMIFAYKLTPNQVQSVLTQLPKWVTSTRYDIEARAAGNPTKDQYRLMMQALLADRFKLAIHFETKQVPVYALALDKPGKFGPQFRQHPSDSPCSTATPTGHGAAPAQADGFPEMCGAFVDVSASNPGRLTIGARNVPMAMIATTFSSQGFGVDRPVVDKTGLTGTFDIVVEFTPQINGPLPPGATFQPDESGPTFLEAMKEQLGLRLDKQTAPVDSIVIDHIEQPSEN